MDVVDVVPIPHPKEKQTPGPYFESQQSSSLTHGSPTTPHPSVVVVGPGVMVDVDGPAVL